MYRTLARRVVVDLKLTPLVFDGLQLTLTTAEVLALMDRLSLIHDALNPPPHHASRDEGGDTGVAGGGRVGPHSRSRTGPPPVGSIIPLTPMGPPKG